VNNTGVTATERHDFHLMLSDYTAKSLLVGKNDNMKISKRILPLIFLICLLSPQSLAGKKKKKATKNSVKDKQYNSKSFSLPIPKTLI
jgi:hypothetical protein